MEVADKKIVRVATNHSSSVCDHLVVEEPLEIWIKQTATNSNPVVEKLMTTMRTPGDDEHLVMGWLNASGLITSSDIESIKQTGSKTLRGLTSNRILVTLKLGVGVQTETLKRFDDATSSCGVCGQQSIEYLLDSLPERNSAKGFSVPQSRVFLLTQELRAMQTLFDKTGGCHGAGLFDAQCKLLDVKEDVGRHNALDKLIGAHLTKLPDKFGIVLSGRVSFELVQKAAMAGASLIVAVGAPSALAVDLCVECDIGLVGFVSEQKYNLYYDNHQIAQC